jgi:uncharacterized protein (TIGR03083 family)
MIEVARRDPGRDVPQYPEWTMNDLMAHTASILGRTAIVCREKLQERAHAPRVPEGGDGIQWFSEQLDEMLEVLRFGDPSTPVWGFGSAPSVGFWVRRMLIEVGVHRFDADTAWGDDFPLLDRVAQAGLDEFSEMWLPRLGEVPTIRLKADEIGRTWTYGPGDPESEVSGTASDLYLRLMSRPSPVVLPPEWSEAVAALTPPTR